MISDTKVKQIQFFKIIITVLAVSASLFHLYGAVWGVFEEYFLRIMHLLFMFLLLFIIDFEKAYSIKDEKKIIINILWIIGIIGSFGYILLNYDYLIVGRFMFVTPLTIPQIIFGIIMILVVLEAARRKVGSILVVSAAVFFTYYFMGPYLPGIFYHSGVTFEKLIDCIFLRTEGIFGIPVGISSTFLIMFIIFGAFLGRSGFGNLITDFALGLFGPFKGGPAKVAVVASCLMGMISGSSNANVVTTGTITIPLMKKVGYKSYFAGAVEAAASCGGQIMPPVMGAAAFMMVEYTGIPYITVIRYALFPGILYFLAIMTMVHLEADKLGLKGIPREKLPDWKSSLKAKGHLVISLIVLVFLLIRGFSPTFSAFYGIITLIIISFIRKNTRMNLMTIIAALEDGAKNSITIAVSCATAGIIIGIVTLTGIGMRFASAFIELSGGNLILALIFAMIAALILGMGIPTVAAYVLLIALIIPALIKLGLEPHVAHLFSLYFACISLITPPIAITSYAAAGIAKANVSKTSWTAMRLGSAAYIVPFMFVFNPPLLLEGSFGEVTLAVMTAIIGIIALSAGLQNHLFRRTTILERLLCLGSSLLLIKSDLVTDSIGIVMLVIVCLLQVKFFPAQTKITA